MQILTENRLSETQGRIKVLEKQLEKQNKPEQKQQQQQQYRNDDSNSYKDDTILSMTISSLQNLVLEKDTSLSRYQELLKTERNHSMRTFDGMSDEIKQLKKIIDGHENAMVAKEKIVDNLKRKVEELKDEW